MTKRKHLFWFDLHFTYDEIRQIEEARQKLNLTQMEYIEKCVRKELNA